MKIRRIKKTKYTLITSGLFLIPILTYLLIVISGVDVYSKVPDNKKAIPLPEFSWIDGENIWIISIVVGFFIWGILNFKIEDENS
jgi:hypothetical protein